MSSRVDLRLSEGLLERSAGQCIVSDDDVICQILSRSRLTWRPLGQALATIMVELSNEEVSPEFLQGLVDSNGPSGLAKVISDVSRPQSSVGRQHLSFFSITFTLH